MAKAEFVKEAGGRTVTITKIIDAPLEKVWDAWSKAELLDKWWGPKPWNAITKEFDFSPGGHWLYNMAGPKGEAQWCREDYYEIEPQKYFTGQDGFCDEQGSLSKDLPLTKWRVEFEEKNGKVKVTTLLTFETEADLNKLFEMGFEDGYNTGLMQLEELLK